MGASDSRKPTHIATATAAPRMRISAAHATSTNTTMMRAQSGGRSSTLGGGRRVHNHSANPPRLPPPPCRRGRRRPPATQEPKPHPSPTGDGTNDALCFVLMPFAGRHHEYYEKIVAPAVREAGLEPVKADSRARRHHSGHLALDSNRQGPAGCSSWPQCERLL